MKWNCFHLEHLLCFSDDCDTPPQSNVHIKHTHVCTIPCVVLWLSLPLQSLSVWSHQIYNTNLLKVPKVTYTKPLLPSDYNSSPMLLITLKCICLIWLEITFPTLQFQFPTIPLNFTQATVPQWALISTWEGILLQGYLLFSLLCLHFTSLTTALSSLLAFICPFIHSLSPQFTELLVYAKNHPSEADTNKNEVWSLSMHSLSWEPHILNKIT